MPGKARLHTHHQQEFKVRDVRQNLLDLGPRIDRQTSGRASFPDQFRGGSWIGLGVLCFDVNRQMVRTSLHEGLDERLRMLNHEMGIQTHLGARATQPCHEIRPHGQVGNKVTIHNIQVQQIAPGLHHVECLGTQLRKISTKHGRGHQWRWRCVSQGTKEMLL